MDRNEFLYGIHSKDLKICPGCGQNTCYWIGGSPNDIECANKDCKFYKKKLDYGKKRYHYESDKPYNEENKEQEDTTEIMEDWDFGNLRGL